MMICSEKEESKNMKSPVVWGVKVDNTENNMFIAVI